MRSLNLYSLSGLVALLLTGCPNLGCAQNQDQKIQQSVPQKQTTETDQAAAGSQTTVRVEPFQPDFHDLAKSLGAATSQPSGVDDAASDGAGGRAAGTGGGGVSIGSLTVAQNITVHSGGSTTGAQSSGGSTGQTATPTGSASAEAVQKPSASVAVPIAVALPGGVAQPSGSATNASEQGVATSTLTPANQAEARALQAKIGGGQGTAADIARLAELLLGPTSRPVTPSPVTP